MKIEFKKPARKFLQSRSDGERIRILKAIGKLPNEGDIVKMSGYGNRYRLRVGNIRVVYEIRSIIDDASSPPKKVLLILVLEIDNRGDLYKQKRT